MRGDLDRGTMVQLDKASVHLTGNGMELIHQSLIANFDDLPSMPLSLASWISFENTPAGLWVVAIWLTTERILARATLLYDGDVALLGWTVGAPRVGKEPEETMIRLVAQSAKDNLTETYGLEGGR